MERQKLYDRIDLRVDLMIAAGLLDEVKKLLAMGYTADLKSMHRHMAAFIDGSLPWEECVSLHAIQLLLWAGPQTILFWTTRASGRHWLAH